VSVRTHAEELLVAVAAEEVLRHIRMLQRDPDGIGGLSHSLRPSGGFVGSLMCLS